MHEQEKERKKCPLCGGEIEPATGICSVCGIKILSSPPPVPKKKEPWETLMKLPGINEEMARSLMGAGFSSINDLAKGTLDDIERALGMDSELAKAVHEEAKNSSLFLCTGCGAFLGPDATVCPVCGAPVDTDEGDEELEYPEAAEKKEDGVKTSLYLCPLCGAFIGANAASCPHCGATFEGEEELIEEEEEIIPPEDVLAAQKEIPETKEEEEEEEVKDIRDIISPPRKELPEDREADEEFNRLLLKNLQKVAEQGGVEEEFPEIEDAGDIREAQMDQENTARAVPMGEDLVICGSCGAILKAGVSLCGSCGSELIYGEPEAIKEAEKGVEDFTRFFGVEGADLTKYLTEDREGEALFICTGCGAFYPEEADKCPICGLPVSEMERKIPDYDIMLTFDALPQDTSISICDVCGAFVPMDKEECTVCGASMSEHRYIPTQIQDEEEYQEQIERFFGPITTELEKEEEPEIEELYLCKVCGAFMSKGASTCPICGAKYGEEGGEFNICPLCGAKVPVNLTVCPICATHIGAEIAEEGVEELELLEDMVVSETEGPAVNDMIGEEVIEEFMKKIDEGGEFFADSEFDEETQKSLEDMLVFIEGEEEKDREAGKDQRGIKPEALTEEEETSVEVAAPEVLEVADEETEKLLEELEEVVSEEFQDLDLPDIGEEEMPEKTKYGEPDLEDLIIYEDKKGEEKEEDTAGQKIEEMPPTEVAEEEEEGYEDDILILEQERERMEAIEESEYEEEELFPEETAEEKIPEKEERTIQYGDTDYEGIEEAGWMEKNAVEDFHEGDETTAEEIEIYKEAEEEGEEEYAEEEYAEDYEAEEVEDYEEGTGLPLEYKEYDEPEETYEIEQEERMERIPAAAAAPVAVRKKRPVKQKRVATEKKREKVGKDMRVPAKIGTGQRKYRETREGILFISLIPTIITLFLYHFLPDIPGLDLSIAAMFTMFFIAGLGLMLVPGDRTYPGKTDSLLMLSSGALFSMILLKWYVVSDTAIYATIDTIVTLSAGGIAVYSGSKIEGRGYFLTWLVGTSFLMVYSFMHIITGKWGAVTPDIVGGIGLAYMMGSGLILVKLKWRELITKSELTAGDESYLQKDYDRALRAYERAIEIATPDNAPDYDIPWYSKGAALISLGRFEEAIECLDRAIQINPKNEITWNNKGNALSRLGRHREAIDCYDRALKINPNYEVAWNNKGNAYARMGRYEEALKCYDMAISINNDYREAWINKGYVLVKLGMYDEAVACANRVIPDRIKSRGAPGI